MSITNVIVFDVNETLSDMAPMVQRFTEVGAPASLASLWFAWLLRDGFALTAAGSNPDFAEVGSETLRVLLEPLRLDIPVEQAVHRIMTGMTELQLHTDVIDAVRMLAKNGHRLITLSNGATTLAERLFADAGIREHFEKLLSVADAPLWKPAPSSYAFAARRCGVRMEEMLLVAAHPWDINGAAEAGLRTCWVNREKTRYPGFFRTPEFTVRDLGELPALLGR